MWFHLCVQCGECIVYMWFMYMWCALVDGNEEGDGDQTKQRTFGAKGAFTGQKCHQDKQRCLGEAGHVLDGPIAPSCGQSV